MAVSQSDMNDDDVDRARVFERHRARLFGIAYRMLATVQDAEDLVQETFLRWQEADLAALREPEGWLVAVITRLAIDRLRHAQVERRAYDGHWLPEPMETPPWAQADHTTELASDLSMAFLVLLERLAPEERAAFLLREVFDAGYGEIAKATGKSEVVCRQMVHRARERVRQERARFAVPADAKERLLERFLKALEAGDKDELLAVFSPEATFTSDGGGKVHATRQVLTGPERILRLLLTIERKWPGALTRRIAYVNGEPTILSYDGERLFSTMSFETDGERILAMYTVLNPDKLTRVGAS